ncbi:MAG: hypothetical protein WAO76_00915 [Georgfuchsia sp.]
MALQIAVSVNAMVIEFAGIGKLQPIHTSEYTNGNCWITKNCIGTCGTKNAVIIVFI